MSKYLKPYCPDPFDFVSGNDSYKLCKTDKKISDPFIVLDNKKSDKKIIVASGPDVNHITTCEQPVDVELDVASLSRNINGYEQVLSVAKTDARKKELQQQIDDSKNKLKYSTCIHTKNNLDTSAFKGKKKQKKSKRSRKAKKRSIKK
jgi:hypothetical protein